MNRIDYKKVTTMNSSEFFHTFHEYMKREDKSLTASMEDYLEMIYRLSSESGFTRITELSKALNVASPSSTRMVQKLAELKLLKYERYGVLVLREEGKMLGYELIKRHNMVERFIKLIGVSDEDALEETEKIEHTVSPKTMLCIERFLGFIRENPEILIRYCEYNPDLTDNPD